MKRSYSLALSLALLLSAANAAAQTPVYGNEWVEAGRTYLKFKVHERGIFRVSKSTLDAAGVPSGTVGANFKMYRDGSEVALLVTAAGQLGGSDYLEFAGSPADGSLDRGLYPTPADQSNDRASLYSDTAAYFLTWDAGTAHLRYTEAANNIPPSPGAPAPWCWGTSTASFKNLWMPGRNNAGGCLPGSGHFLHSSQYDRGEGFVRAQRNPWDTEVINLSTPGSVAAGVGAMFYGGVIGRGWENPHLIKVLLNNTQIFDTAYGHDETKRIQAQAAQGVTYPAVTEVKYASTPGGSCYSDVWGASFAELQYPRNFNAAGADFFSFRLPAGSPAYLEIENISGGAPRLYDLTTRTVMNGVTGGNGKMQFIVPLSMNDREMVLVGSSSSYRKAATPVKTFQFTDWAARQSTYLIISHNRLMAPVNGKNMVAEYRDYRASAAGGGWSAAVADVDELYDQFGYGVAGHPIALRRFLHWAYNTWTTKPQSVFIIGHGLLYYQLPAYNAAPATYDFPIVPSYGAPGSDLDLVNFGPSAGQMMGIGRLSVRSAAQIGIYLEKVRTYEAVQRPAPVPTYASEGWKKSALHIAGASDIDLQQSRLLPTLRDAEAVIRDTATGYAVRTVAKNNTNPIDPVTTPFVDSLMNGGMQLLTFHGHAGSAGFDYNINTPENYRNAPRYPVFVAMGCEVGQIFTLQQSRTISERYLDHADGGAIAMLAQNSLGFVNWHALYLPALYRTMANEGYGTNIGEQMRLTYNGLTSAYGWLPTSPNQNDRFFFCHFESLLLQGDPAVRLYSAPKPDYHVAGSGLNTLPVSVSTAMDSFQLRIISFNLGRATGDSEVLVRVEHTSPQNLTTTAASYKLRGRHFSDTVAVWVRLDKTKDLGLNRYQVTIDAANRYDEVSEINNSAAIDVFIFSDDLVPVYPYQYSIINSPTVTLKASSLNPFRKEGRYRMELDTTALFNSPLKQATTLTAPGGIVRWTPAGTLLDSTVYYWRTAFDSTVAGQYNWGVSSFVRMAGAGPGWNQSHYFQLKSAALNQMDYGEDRRFSYQRYDQKFTVDAKIMFGNPDVDSNRFLLNDVEVQSGACPSSHGGVLQVLVVDSLTGQIWRNNGTSGAAPPNCLGSRGNFVFEYRLWHQSEREAARRFLDSIPVGNYVLIKNSVLYAASYGAPSIGFYQPSPALSWKADENVYGAGKSLYHQLKGMGFSQLDSYTKLQPFYFIAQKGISSWPKQQAVGTDSSVTFSKSITIPGRLTSGSVASVSVGPASEWKTLQWTSRATDGKPENDTVKFAVWGLPGSGPRTLLYTGTATDTSLAWISADAYPRLQLEWSSRDTVNRSTQQLGYWRVLYTPMPEAALVPGKLFAISDSLEVGQMQELAVGIENISDLPMDSMLVSYKVIDAGGVTHTVARQRYKPLPAGDTIQARLSFDPARFVGRNTLFIEANPDNDQPEQYHPNNLGYLSFRTDKDERNPLLDVTFDGVHILDRDIVSSKPFIKIMLKDENRYLALDDTGLLKVYIHHPNDEISSRRLVPFDGTVCKFIPAVVSEGKLVNEAYIEYRPQLTERSLAEDQHIYELSVSAKDRTGNSSGPDYRITFEVIFENSITRLLNYPNPFSTSTAFLFTLTGSEIPAQFKIQIMTVSGKVVREITKAELGPIHVGRNITDYRWDGRDQYGQMLGNGVYLYRVVTALSAGELEHRESGADKFFTKGWGKMYIMR